MKRRSKPTDANASRQVRPLSNQKLVVSAAINQVVQNLARAGLHSCCVRFRAPAASSPPCTAAPACAASTPGCSAPSFFSPDRRLGDNPPPVILDNYSPRGPITPPRATPGWPAAMSAHKRFQTER